MRVILCPDNLQEPRIYRRHSLATGRMRKRMVQTQSLFLALNLVSLYLGQDHYSNTIILVVIWQCGWAPQEPPDHGGNPCTGKFPLPLMLNTWSQYLDLARSATEASEFTPPFSHSLIQPVRHCAGNSEMTLA